MLSKLKKKLQERYGEEWFNIEPETVSLDLGIILTPIMLSQIYILKALALEPTRFQDDASYFLRFVEAANGHFIDPTVSYMPNSLELAWGLYELKKIWPELQFGNAIKVISHYILQDEGYPGTVPPFDFIDLPFENKWAEPGDLEKKAKAIRLYGLAQEELNG